MEEGKGPVKDISPIHQAVPDRHSGYSDNSRHHPCHRTQGKAQF